MSGKCTCLNCRTSWYYDGWGSGPDYCNMCIQTAAINQQTQAIILQAKLQAEILKRTTVANTTPTVVTQPKPVQPTQPAVEFDPLPLPEPKSRWYETKLTMARVSMVLFPILLFLYLGNTTSGFTGVFITMFGTFAFAFIYGLILVMIWGDEL